MGIGGLGWSGAAGNVRLAARRASETNEAGHQRSSPVLADNFAAEASIHGRDERLPVCQVHGAADVLEDSLRGIARLRKRRGEHRQ